MVSQRRLPPHEGSASFPMTDNTRIRWDSDRRVFLDPNDHVLVVYDPYASATGLCGATSGLGQRCRQVRGGWFDVEQRSTPTYTGSSLTPCRTHSSGDRASPAG